MKESLLHNWNLFRFLRLVMGIAIFVQAIMVKDIFLGLAGLLFSGMALFNMGCCGTAGCYMPPKQDPETKKDISYEEVV